MNINPKVILHIDMNSYFASVEQQANPHLRGKPVGVCEHLGGIIIAPSVEAKRLGIKLGTTVWDARKIFPGIVLLPVDPPKYRQVTAEFLRILLDYTDEVEKYSIDEAFMDISGFCKDSNDALLLALEIKQRLRLEVGEWVSASIGIGPNKLIAKIAADLDSGVILERSDRISDSIGPLGLQNDVSFLDRVCVIKPENIPSLYDLLSLTDVPGIGLRLEKALHKLGIFSLWQLANYPVANLINQFGINGYFLQQMANFQDTDEIVTEDLEEIKSIGHSYTLPRAISDLRDIKKLMYKLSEKIGRRLRRQGARGNVVHYFHSDKRYSGFSKQHQIRELINDGREIYQAAWRIFKLGSPLEFPIKIMGISVGGLKFGITQEFLFEQYKKPRWLVLAMDRINDKYGEFTIRRARLVNTKKEWAKDTVGFGRMKEFLV